MGTELKNLIENYEFPCVGAWDGFHVYVCSKLKSYFSFKKRYTVSNLALVGYNKQIFYVAVDAPGSTHDARMLKNTQLYQKILESDAIYQRPLYIEYAPPVCSIFFITVSVRNNEGIIPFFLRYHQRNCHLNHRLQCFS